LRFPAIPGMEKVTRTNEICLLRDWIRPDADAARVSGARVPQIDADVDQSLPRFFLTLS